FTSKSRFSALTCSIFADGTVPPGAAASLTRMSMPPSACTAFATRLATAASSPISATMGTTLRPVAAASSRAVASSGAKVRAAIATSTPSAANCNAIALPMPRLPPVTSARLPVSSKSIACSSIRWQLAETGAVIDRQHLAGDEVGAVDEPAHHLGDVFGIGGFADRRDLRLLDDALVVALLAEEVLHPARRDEARRHGVDADHRRELAGQRNRHRVYAAFRRAVRDRRAFTVERAKRRDIDDRAIALLFHLRHDGADHLIGADDIDGVDLEKVRCVEGLEIAGLGGLGLAGAIDQRIDPPPARDRRRRHTAALRVIGDV